MANRYLIPFTILDRYIILSILGPFFSFSFFFISLILSVMTSKVLADLLLKGLAFEKILIFFLSAVIEQLPTILPIIGFFSGVLAANRLSNDLELTAMRASGMSYFRIYRNFITLGAFLAIFMFLVNAFWAPFYSKRRQALAEWVFAYQSIAFVQSRSFFNRFIWSGDHVDIYAEERRNSSLKDIYIHRWNISNSVESTTIYHEKGKNKVGKSKTLQLIIAKKGELIQRSSFQSIKDEQKENQTSHENMKKRVLPMNLRGRSLTDLTFAGHLPNLEDSQNVKKYIRLKSGYVIDLSRNYERVDVTDFRKGLMDYSLKPPSRVIGYLALAPNALQLDQLLDIYDKMHTGGLVVDENALHSGEKSNPANFTEIVPQSLIPIIEKDIGKFSQLSHGAIWEKYGLYIPEKAETPATRQEYLEKSLQYAKKIREEGKKILFLIHKYIASSLGFLLLLALSFPLGVSQNRSGKGSRYGLALLIYCSYSILGNYMKLGFRKGIHPVIAGWVPEFFLLLCLLFILVRNRK